MENNHNNNSPLGAYPQAKAWGITAPCIDRRVVGIEKFGLKSKVLNPELFNNIGIVELIDRTVNKGVILNADLVVTVADVPLLAANLRLALASVETMLKYGMMNDLLKPQVLPPEKLPEKIELMKIC